MVLFLSREPVGCNGALGKLNGFAVPKIQILHRHSPPILLLHGLGPFQQAGHWNMINSVSATVPKCAASFHGSVVVPDISGWPLAFITILPAFVVSSTRK
jgi:hypothetical protein